MRKDGGFLCETNSLKSRIQLRNRDPNRRTCSIACLHLSNSPFLQFSISQLLHSPLGWSTNVQGRRNCSARWAAKALTPNVSVA